MNFSKNNDHVLINTDILLHTRGVIFTSAISLKAHKIQMKALTGQ